VDDLWAEVADRRAQLPVGARVRRLDEAAEARRRAEADVVGVRRLRAGRGGEQAGVVAGPAQGVAQRERLELRAAGRRRVVVQEQDAQARQGPIMSRVAGARRRGACRGDGSPSPAS
jgi:hypothetical protein